MLILGATDEEAPEAQTQTPHDDRPERGAVADFDDRWGIPAPILLNEARVDARFAQMLGSVG